MFGYLLALFCLLASAFLLGDWFYHQKRCTVKVRARISEVQHHRPGRMRKESRHFYPVYTFTYEEQVYTVCGKEPSRTNQWKVGDEADLFFAPGNPDCFRVGKRTGDLVYGAAALAAGILFLVVGRMAG